MIVYRLTKEKYKDTLSGKGASIRGGRWNSPGVELIYTAANRALAMTEVAVHITFQMMPNQYWVIEIEIPDNLTVESCDSLPPDWNSFPYNDASRKLGDKLVYENKSLALKVPSAVVQKEWNILINPFHPDFKQVKIINKEPFQLDRRLF